MNNIVVVGLNPTLQKTLIFDDFFENEINRIEKHRFDASGKGVNVCRVLKQLNEDPLLISHSDDNLFSSMIKSEKIRMINVISSKKLRYCYTILNLKKRTTTEIIESTEPIEQNISTDIFNEYKILLKNASLIVFSGSSALGYKDGIIPDMVRVAKDKNITVILDIKGSNLLSSLSKKPDILKINLDELIETFPEKSINYSLEELLTYIYTEYSCKSVITRGSEDLVYYDGEKYGSLPIKNADAINTTGCGDTMTASIAKSIKDGNSFIDSLKKAIIHSAKNAESIIPGSII